MTLERNELCINENRKIEGKKKEEILKFFRFF